MSASPRSMLARASGSARVASCSGVSERLRKRRLILSLTFMLAVWGWRAPPAASVFPGTSSRVKAF